MTNVLSAQMSLTDKEIEDYKSQVKQMVSYFQETLNFIGDPNNIAKEKDIVFKESYTKIFKDEHVQIEDDLDEERGMSINKDVQAYLKDIDFFYQNVKFRFDIQKITPQINEKGETFFKINMMRNIAGRTITGDSINNTRNRFMEINIDPLRKDLKIVSLYTTKPNENEELSRWWNVMSDEWKHYFGMNVYLNDTIEWSSIKQILTDSLVITSLEDVILKDTFMLVDNDTLEMNRIDELYGHTPDTVIFIHDTVKRFVNKVIPCNINMVYPCLKDMMGITEVNVSDNDAIFNLDPLSELSELTYLDCSGTKVTDITPIRNLNKINYLDISGTNITNISNLRYTNNIEILKADNININNISVTSLFSKLRQLSVSNTDVFDLSPLSNCSNLFILNVSYTDIDSISVLRDLKELYDVNLSYTAVDDLSPLQEANKLHFINIEGSQISDLSPLASLDNLSEINCSNTSVSNIEPLKNIKNLKRVYCDNSMVNREMAFEFMRINTNALVINETKTLELWWEDLPSFWKTLLIGHNNSEHSPSKEQLHSIINIKSLKIDKDDYILDLNPIVRFTNLENLDLSGSTITDISQLKSLYNLKSLNISDTKITDINILENNTELKELNIENTKIKSLLALHNLNNLSFIMAENTELSNEEVVNLKKKNRKLKVIYKTDELRTWWANLSTSWREILSNHVKCNSNPTSEQLHEMADLEDIIIDPMYVVQDIEPLRMMPFVKKLQAENNQIHDLTPLGDKEFMEVLIVKANPIDDLSPIENLLSMKVVNVENTAVHDLSPLEAMSNLTVLNVGGTTVSNLKPLSDLSSLQELLIFNTNVKSLNHIKNLPSLKHVAAYKTRMKEKEVQLLRLERPEVNILYY